jgi:ATP-dependent DNA ligase
MSSFNHCASVTHQGKNRNTITSSWVKPRLVANVRFTEKTSDGQLRHPAFLVYVLISLLTVTGKKRFHHPIRQKQKSMLSENKIFRKNHRAGNLRKTIQAFEGKANSHRGKPR